MIESVHLTQSGHEKLRKFLREHARGDVSPDAVRYEMLDALADRIDAAESLVYELGAQYTRSGRPELLRCEWSDLEIAQSDNTTVSLKNPWSGALVERDISDLTQSELDAYAQRMDDDLRESLASRLAPCSPAEFLAAWVAEVGPEEAGRVILS